MRRITAVRVGFAVTLAAAACAPPDGPRGEPQMTGSGGAGGGGGGPDGGGGPTTAAPGARDPAPALDAAAAKEAGPADALAVLPRGAPGPVPPAPWRAS